MLNQLKTWLADKLKAEQRTQSITDSITITEFHKTYNPLLQHQERKIAELQARVDAFEAQQSNDILAGVQALFVKQTEKGIRKYGAAVKADNLTQVEWCQHALEEHADSMVYLMALKKQLEEVSENGSD